ncbi:hypothetical protein PISMIDRAFT_113902, partial [Pisolithus microcarpus 441]
ELNVDPLTLGEFEAMVRKDFAGIGPFPTYILPLTMESIPTLSANFFAPAVPTSRGPPLSLTCIAIPLLHTLRVLSCHHISPLQISQPVPSNFTVS